MGAGAYGAMATIGRLGRIAAVLGPLVERVFAQYGLAAASLTCWPHSAAAGRPSR
jgi:hypothetical protein